MAAKVISSRSVLNLIRSRILMSGPIPVADYMRLALTHLPQVSNQNQGISESLAQSPVEPNQNEGYYMKKDVFGQQGDFITSPEISQMFGELLGVWGIQCWKQLKAPNTLRVVELGPGRGTLSRDMLRVFHQLENVIGKDVALNLVEISPYLSQMQFETLCTPTDESSKGKVSTNSISYRFGVCQGSNYPVTWYKNIHDVPKEFSLYIAHEFFDALPIHKLQKVSGDWREVLVDIIPDNEDSFRFVISRHETPVLKVLKSRYAQVFETSREHLEISLDALVILEELTSRLEEFGGVALIIDYGHEGTKGDTFRAFSKHKLHDPLVNPGSADLTADVDFSILKQLLSEKALICGPVSQKTFLSRVGIDMRLDSLLQAAKTEDDKVQLKSGYKMIMDDMGTRFHFMSLFPKVLEQFLPKLKIVGFHE